MTLNDVHFRFAVFIFTLFPYLKTETLKFERVKNCKYRLKYLLETITASEEEHILNAKKKKKKLILNL